MPVFSSSATLHLNGPLGKTAVSIQAPLNMLAGAKANSQVPGLGLEPIFEGDIFQPIALGKKDF